VRSGIPPSFFFVWLLFNVLHHLDGRSCRQYREYPTSRVFLKSAAKRLFKSVSVETGAIEVKACRGRNALSDSIESTSNS